MTQPREPETSQTKHKRRRVALFRRFPALIGRPAAAPFDAASDTLLDVTDQSRPLTLEAAADQYRHLAPALRELQAVVVPLYDECNTEALLEQNRHRRQQVLLLIGALITTSFGSIQAALAGSVWPGIVVAVVAAATSAVSSVGRRSASLDRYLEFRRRAERLRSLYFRYLAGSVGGAEPHASRAALQEQAVSLRYDNGPAA
jgi:heme exporter protein D